MGDEYMSCTNLISQIGIRHSCGHYNSTFSSMMDEDGGCCGLFNHVLDFADEIYGKSGMDTG